MPELHRGRLIDHVQIVVDDLHACRRFYCAVFELLGIPVVDQLDQGFFFADAFCVSSRDSEAAIGELTGRVHIAFATKDRAVVDRFHRVALAAGGSDLGPPGERPYHPGYYAAFVRDPAGNNVEVVYHGEGEYSTDSVVVRW